MDGRKREQQGRDHGGGDRRKQFPSQQGEGEKGQGTRDRRNGSKRGKGRAEYPNPGPAQQVKQRRMLGMIDQRTQGIAKGAVWGKSLILQHRCSGKRGSGE